MTAEAVASLASLTAQAAVCSPDLRTACRMASLAATDTAGSSPEKEAATATDVADADAGADADADAVAVAAAAAVDAVGVNDTGALSEEALGAVARRCALVLRLRASATLAIRDGARLRPCGPSPDCGPALTRTQAHSRSLTLTHSPSDLHSPPTSRPHRTPSPHAFTPRHRPTPSPHAFSPRLHLKPSAHAFIPRPQPTPWPLSMAGARGSLLLCDGKLTRMPAVAVAVADPTGAGNAYTRARSQEPAGRRTAAAVHGGAQPEHPPLGRACRVDGPMGASSSRLRGREECLGRNEPKEHHIGTGQFSASRYAGALGALLASGRLPGEAAAVASAVGAAFCRADGWPGAAEAVWVAARAAEMPAGSGGR